MVTGDCPFNGWKPCRKKECSMFIDLGEGDCSFKRSAWAAAECRTFMVEVAKHIGVEVQSRPDGGLHVVAHPERFAGD